MLLEDVDEKLSTNMREEAVNCRGKGASATATCDAHVSAMASSGPRTLQQSKTCECLCDGGVVGVRVQNVNPDEYRTPRTRRPDPTGNGNTIAPQRKIFNFNEDLHRRVPRHGDTNMNVSGDAVCSCPVICIDSTKETRPSVTVNSESLACVEEDRCAVIRLSLRKPRHWKWKLTTSASSPAVILLDERGDLLIDTGKRSGPPVDSNGNDTYVQSTNDPSGLTQRNGSEQHSICAEYREDVHLNNGKATGRLVKVFEQKQKDKMKNMLLHEGQRSMIPQRSGPEEAVETRRTGGKNQRAQSLNTSARSMSTQKESRRCSESNGSVKDCRLSRSNVHRRFVERRRDCADSATSSDSSPEVRRRTVRRDRTTGRTLFCAGHAPLMLQTRGQRNA
jgi:hypothetical protein